MKRQQFLKILQVTIITTAIMFAFEALFAHSVITDWLENFTKNSGEYVYLVLFAIMFIQVCFIPIPAYIVLNTAVYAKLVTTEFMHFALHDLWFYLTVILAYMLGIIVAYFIGRKWGRKAVRWCAGSDEDYDKWSGYLNKKGKWWYFLTVLLPVFPDDLLCFVAGSVKFDLKFFLFSNFTGRMVGLFVGVESLKLLGMTNKSFPTSLLVWGVVLLGEIILFTILKIKDKKKEKNNETRKES